MGTLKPTKRSEGPIAVATRHLPLSEYYEASFVRVVGVDSEELPIGDDLLAGRDRSCPRQRVYVFPTELTTSWSQAALHPACAGRSVACLKVLGMIAAASLCKRFKARVVAKVHSTTTSYSCVLRTTTELELLFSSRSAKVLLYRKARLVTDSRRGLETCMPLLARRRRYRERCR